jgi:hypothetical protein
MKVSTTCAFVAAACVSGTSAFGVVAPLRQTSVTRQFAGQCLWDAPPATSTTSTDMADVDIPKTLPSDVGMDYVPLATFLATGQLAEADQVSHQHWETLFVNGDL